MDATPEPEAEPEAEQEPEPEPRREPEQGSAKEKPASSGAAHTPKTNVDINESGSLFDL